MNQPQQSDEWLMGQVQRGRREELEKLVRRYASGLLTFIQRTVRDRHRAEELFQETFLRVWTKRRTYDLDRPFRSWLFAIAANLCRTELRKRKPATLQSDQAEQLTAAGSQETESPAEAAMAVETAAIVLEGISRLPPQQRMIVVLRVWNGMKFAEIAETFNLAESTIRSSMHRGLASLKVILEPRLGRSIHSE